MNSSYECTDIQGSVPTDEDLYWLQIARNLTENSMDAANEGARNQVGIANTLMTGGYAAIISFSGLKDILAIGGWQKSIIIMLIVAPMLFWLLSLLFAYTVCRVPNVWTLYTPAGLLYSSTTI